MRTIVVGFDGSDGAKRALGRAAEVARAFSASLVVLTVTDLPIPVSPYAVGSMGTFGPEPIIEPVYTGIDPEEIAGRLLAEARELVQGADAEFIARTGDAGDALLQVAKERAADLLVVGKRELGFLERLLEGSVSADLAKHAHCDVLIVHPPHASAD